MYQKEGSRSTKNSYNTFPSLKQQRKVTGTSVGCTTASFMGHILQFSGTNIGIRQVILIEIFVVSLSSSRPMLEYYLKTTLTGSLQILSNLLLTVIPILDAMRTMQFKCASKQREGE
jgi:hypothetical protein